MKRTALLALAISANALGAGISGLYPYYLETTGPAGITFDAGPQPYNDWFAGAGYGEIGYLVFTAVPQGIVTSFALLPCPVTSECPPVRDSVTIHAGPEQAPVGTPEPGTFALMLAALACVIRRRSL
jgi:hypothetical protein